MSRIARFVLFAGLLTALAAGVADADTIAFSTTPFTGQATDLTNVGSDYDIYDTPFTDHYGNTISGGVYDVIESGYGVSFGAPSSQILTDTLTFTLAAATKEIGFLFNTAGGGSDADYLASATFSDGSFVDTFTGGVSYTPNTVAFMGFADDRAFTEVSLTFHFPNDINAELMSGFVTAQTAVPEPASLVNMALASMAGLGCATYRRWRKRLVR